MRAIEAVRRQALETPASRGILPRNRPVAMTLIVRRGLVATRNLEPPAARVHVPRRQPTAATVRTLSTTTETIRSSVLTVRRPLALTPRRGHIPRRAAAIRHRRAPTPLRRRHARTPRQAIRAAAVAAAIVVAGAAQARTAGAGVAAALMAAVALLLTAGHKVLRS
jgi:hypothetical protein